MSTPGDTDQSQDYEKLQEKLYVVTAVLGGCIIMTFLILILLATILTNVKIQLKELKLSSLSSSTQGGKNGSLGVQPDMYRGSVDSDDSSANHSNIKNKRWTDDEESEETCNTNLYNNKRESLSPSILNSQYRKTQSDTQYQLPHPTTFHNGRNSMATSAKREQGNLHNNNVEDGRLELVMRVPPHQEPRQIPHEVHYAAVGHPHGGQRLDNGQETVVAMVPSAQFVWEPLPKRY